MAQIGKCERCGAAVPSGGSVQGMCPRCLMEIAQSWSAGGAPAGAPPASQELAALFPALEIGELLGRGGMGAVYKARHKELDRPVALKILPPEVYSDPTFAERFEREARTLARLDHPNVVRVHDAGRAGGRYYLMMELVDGVDLRQMIRAGRVEPREALSIVGQVCDALQYAHDQGVVHRDVKPENILVDRQGRVKIADFGLAKLLGRERGAYTLTRSDQAMGTLHYMAPEQVERPLSVDHRADIYSLGVVFYELLTGELPIGRFQPPSAKVAVDVRLDDVVLRTLEKEPERRYQHASDVKLAVGDASRPAPPPVPCCGERRERERQRDVQWDEEPVPAGRRHRRRGPWGWLLGCGCLSGLMFLAFLFVVPMAGYRHMEAARADAQAQAAHDRALAERARAQAREAAAVELPAEAPEEAQLEEEPPRLSRELADRLGLDEETVRRVDELLAGARVKYLAIEAERTVREWEGPEVVKVTIAPFREELELLTGELARDLRDATGSEEPARALHETGLLAGLLPYGTEPVELRIDHTDGQSYEVTERLPVTGSVSAVRRATLPASHARFWR